jgi:hypothetical protein
MIYLCIRFHHQYHFNHQYCFRVLMLCPSAARVKGYRRVFRHPAAIFFERGIANMETQEISSLCAEPADLDSTFVVAVFDVPQPTPAEMAAFRRREEEFDLVDAPFEELDSGVKGSGLLCCASTDAAFVAQWGQQTFDRKYRAHGLETIWNYSGDILPCAVYLRHCVLAVSKEGTDPRALASFLDETFLADRITTVRQYLAKAPHVIQSRPPPSLAGRYSG